MAVIKRTCFTSIRNRTQQGFARDRSNRMFLLIMLVIAVGIGEQVQATPSTKGCNLPATAFSASITRTLTPSLGPVQPVHGPVCGAGSCCVPEWEHQLTSDHRNTTERYLRDAIFRAASILETRGQRVDELFRAMMNTSKLDFHTMFVKTYGMIYIQNADVFEDMYQNLEMYYAKGSLKLTDMMDHFFSVLYQRMFKVINGDYEYDAKYLACVADHMGALKPFDDVPLKLGQQLRRSFVATRVFYKSLIKGGRVAATMLQLDLPVDECGAHLTRMHNCGRCLYSDAAGAKSADAGDTRACFWYCREAYTACLRDYMELGADWDKYIDAIDKVADRLIGSFNIEIVIQPIDIKISEAIMNFQENREDITAKVFNVCGKPQLKRRRRNASTYFDDNKEEQAKEIPVKKKKFQGKRKHKKTKGQQQEVTMDGFEKEIYEIKTKIKELRQFWSHLPYQLCNNNNGGTVAPPNPSNQCWTGTQLANNSPPASTQAPPTTSSSSRSVIQKQALILQTLTFRLKDAYNGNDVDYPDDDNLTPVVEDGGSGDGSGDRMDTDDDIDLDLERGSGDGLGRRRPSIDTDNDDDEDNRPHRHPPPNTTERKVQLATVAPPAVTETPPPPYRPQTPPTPAVVTIAPPQHKDTSGKANGAPSRWELRRAILQYMMPIVAMWFGNALSTLL